MLSLYRTLVLLVTLTLVPACSFVMLQGEKEIVKAYAGQIQVNLNKTRDHKPIVLLMLKKQSGGYDLYSHALLNKKAQHDFFVENGEYVAFAFEDLNGDLVFQENEPHYAWASPIVITFDKSTKWAERSVSLDAFAVKKHDYPFDHAMLRISVDGGIRTGWTGELVSFDDYRLSGEMGNFGFWKPARYFLHNGGGIFYLEAYDPNRIPVVFVHGIQGYPKEFETWVSRIDQEKYQIWFAAYPSFYRLEGVAKGLFQSLYKTKSYFDIEKMHIVAHSMGGLVSTKMIQLAEEENDQFFERFITISTPWLGHELAGLGAKYSPVDVPAWNDMQTNSDFINGLHAQGLPSSIKHYMVVTYAGDNMALEVDNDGSVSLVSQLDESMQYCARFVHSVNETHVSVFKNAVVGDLINELLSASIPKPVLCNR